MSTLVCWVVHARADRQRTRVPFAVAELALFVGAGQ